MKISMVKFGEFLMSRPAGHEGAQIMCASFAPGNESEIIELDFAGVKASGPSWIHEVVLGLRTQFKNKIVVLDCGNSSVIESLKFLDLS
ncbi:MAG: DUF4325 domain-containing protein [Bdellovibrionales bacterium]|nr:DUF4325 domain-containing protein [Oligoflexia bacterium]